MIMKYLREYNIYLEDSKQHDIAPIDYDEFKEIMKEVQLDFFQTDGATSDILTACIHGEP